MRQAAERARESNEDNTVALVDLGIADSPVELERLILDDADVQKHMAGSGRLHLFLDALDEAKVAVRSAVSVLERCLSKFDPARLLLRVSCRTAERQPQFEAWLADFVGGSSFKVLELCPLRVSEAKEAVLRAGLDVDQFIEGAIHANISALAARPLTLNLLIEVYAEDGSFPDRLTALYERALLLMVSENDPERATLRELSGSEAFAVASRIAAGTVLCAHDAVGRHGTHIQELLGGDEIDRVVAVPTRVAVNEAHVCEVLDTALFTARPHGVGWAHRTFGEFLAAYWLADRRLSLDQTCDLVLQEDSTGQRVIPALRSVAGWLCVLRRDFIARLDPTDAAVPILFGDPGSIAPADQRRAVSSMFEAVEDREIDPAALRLTWPRLEYEGLNEDLKGILLDPAADLRKREAALDAAGAAGFTELSDLLVEVALDTDAPVTLRTSALISLDGVAVRKTREVSGALRETRLAIRADRPG